MKNSFLLFSLLLPTLLFAQNPEIPTYTLSSYVPAAPSVSGLMHFAEIPVNECTGVPAVS